MKKIILFISAAFIFNAVIAQSPTILGTYLPVVNTEIKQVWVHTGVNNGPSPSATLSVPSYGANQIWDYSNMPVAIESGSDINTHTLKTVPTNTYPGNDNGSNYPEATHASHWTSPISTFDTVWTYSKVDTAGMHTVGVVNLSSGFPVHIDYQETNYSTGMELVVPSHVDMNTVKRDTILRETILPFTPSGFPNVPASSSPLTIHQYSYKKIEAKGYGTLTTPLGMFEDVLLGRETDHEITYYINNTSDTVFAATYDRTYYKHFFLRNNTFATSLLMQLNTEATNSVVSYAWYTLPSKVGSIEGNIYDTIGSTTGVSSAEVYLFREHGNFTRDDVLATVTTDTNGTYIFEDIPYGMYRIAARMIYSQNGFDHEHTYMSYFEDTASTQNNPALGVDWTQCDLITTTGATTTGKNVYIRHDTLEAVQAAVAVSHANVLVGDVFMDETGAKQGGNDPVEGIDIIIKREGISSPVISTTTDENGVYSFENIPDGDYKLWVDMPGLGMLSSYSFNVTNGDYDRCEFDFDVGKDDIFREDKNTTEAGDCYTVGVKEINSTDKTNEINLFPNPFENSSTLTINLGRESNLSIEVFDLTGKKVLTIVNNMRYSGQKDFMISDIQHSGVYFVKVSIDNEIQTTRLIKY